MKREELEIKIINLEERFEVRERKNHVVLKGVGLAGAEEEKLAGVVDKWMQDKLEIEVVMRKKAIYNRDDLTQKVEEIQGKIRSWAKLEK